MSVQDSNDKNGPIRGLSQASKSALGICGLSHGSGPSFHLLRLFQRIDKGEITHQQAVDRVIQRHTRQSP